MTDEQIDALDGQELDAAFAEAFNWAKRLFTPTPLDHGIAALPDDWLLRGSVRIGSAPNPLEWFVTIVLKSKEGIREFTAQAPTPSTALRRAALKAKRGQRPKTGSLKPEATSAAGWAPAILAGIKLAIEGCPCNQSMREAGHLKGCFVPQLEAAVRDMKIDVLAGELSESNNKGADHADHEAT